MVHRKALKGEKQQQLKFIRHAHGTTAARSNTQLLACMGCQASVIEQLRGTHLLALQQHCCAAEQSLHWPAALQRLHTQPP